MKRGLIILILLIVSGFASQSAFANEPVDNDPILPAIFIWELPENEDEDEILSVENEYLEDEEEAITLEPDNTTVKGYLEYAEGTNAILLKNNNNELVLNLRVPQKFDTSSKTNTKNLPMTSFAQNVYARSSDITYNIAPLDTNTVLAKNGGFSIGTAYNESIDKSDLGFTTAFYTKYDQKYFSLSSSYQKEAGVAYSLVVDKFSVTPELKLNNYVSIKDVLTSDITRNRKQNSLVLSIKPTRDDRVRFEFGAGQTYDENKALVKSEIKFSTQFNW